MASDFDETRIERLLALNLIDGRKDNESIKLLHKAGYNSSEIEDFINLNASTIRSRLQKLRDEDKL